MRDSLSMSCLLFLVMLFALAKLGISAAHAVHALDASLRAPSLTSAQAMK